MTIIVMCRRVRIPMSWLRSSHHLQGILSLVKHVIIKQLHIIFSEIWTHSFCICCINNDLPMPIVASNSRNIQRNELLNLNLSMDILANASQFVESHGAKDDVVQHNSRRFQNEIMASR